VDGIVAGMAGASDDCEMMWQIGISVLPEYRGRGIAAALTNRLAIEILKADRAMEQIRRYLDTLFSYRNRTVPPNQFITIG